MRSGSSMTAASALRSRCTSSSMRAGCGVFERVFSGPTREALAVSVTNVNRERLPPASSLVSGRAVLGKVLIGAVGAQHVGRAHPRQATVVAMLAGSGRIVAGQIIEGGRNAALVQVGPKRHSLPAQHGGRRFVADRPDRQLHAVFADLPRSFGGERLGRGEKRRTLALRVAVDEVENPVRARPGAVDETGPGHGALRRDAGSQRAEPAPPAEPVQVRQFPGVHHGQRQARIHAVHADDDHALLTRRGRAVAVLATAGGHAKPRRRQAAAADCFKTSLRLRFSVIIIPWQESFKRWINHETHETHERRRQEWNREPRGYPESRRVWSSSTKTHHKTRENGGSSWNSTTPYGPFRNFSDSL